MKKEAAKKPRKQESIPAEMSMVLGQLVLPMMLASEAIKKGLLAFVQQIGLLAYRELLEGEAETIAGPKGKHQGQRTHHHWGTAPTPLPFGGRHVVVQRPRVRRKGKGGKEVELPSVAAAREADPMPTHVAEQVIVGVSTRGYKRSLEPADESLETRGESKSNVSRALIENTTEKLADFLARNLADLDIVAMFMDGIEIGKHAVIIALGVTADGTKVPLGVWCGSTENTPWRRRCCRTSSTEVYASTLRSCSSSMAARACVRLCPTCSAIVPSSSAARYTRPATYATISPKSAARMCADRCATPTRARARRRPR